MNAEALRRAEAVVESVRREFAPDPRSAVFEVVAESRDGVVALTGCTSEPLAAEALHRRIAALGGGIAVADEVQRLPVGDADELIHGLVSSAAAPMMATPEVNGTQVSQAVLGTRLTVLRSEGRWLQCRTSDRYVGWIHAGYLSLMDETAVRAWEVGAGGEACISLGATVLGADGTAIARLPWGARVVREDADTVRLPDGRRGRPEGELVPAGVRPLGFPAEGAAVCRTLLRWEGVHYLWGGITMGGVDCSGLVQSVFRLHGVELPRDSDQQSHAGAPVKPGEAFAALLPGDLLFFEETPGQCTHVAVSLGGSRIVHAAIGNGGVALNDLAGRRRYERELARLFARARRVLP